VVFVSGSTSLVPHDRNHAEDVFVHDRVAGTTRLVSAASDGSQADSDSYHPRMSANGRYVAFDSTAANLVPGDTNGDSDVFVRDLRTGTTERVSVSVRGAQGNNASFGPSISADGRLVAFMSWADDLLPGSPHRRQVVYVHDRRTGAIELVSVNSDETANGHSWTAQISATGRYVAISSYATNHGHTRSFTDAFLRDRRRGTTRVVSVAADGGKANMSSDTCGVSADGRYVAFVSWASNLVPEGTTVVPWRGPRSHVYVRDMRRGTTSLVDRSPDGSEADQRALGCSLSSNGRFVVFNSAAENLVPGDTNRCRDVFVWDRRTQQVTRVSVSRRGTQADRSSFSLAISANGQVVAFASPASNLISRDTNQRSDVFVRSR
jgi:Tol biopolymer transport system component